jgi:signal transduction histidine kinase
MSWRERLSGASHRGDPVKHPVTAAAAAFVASALFFVATAAAIPVRSVTPLIVTWCLACIAAVIVSARRLGPLYGVPLAIAAGVALDSFYFPPTRQFGERYWQNWIAVATYIGLGVVIGALAAGTRRRADVSESARAELADEQAALRRVAVLVAQQPSPEEVFRAVTEAVGPLLGADLTAMHSYPGDGAATVIASWSAAGPTLPVGMRLPLDGDSVAARIFRNGAAARIDDYAEVAGDTAAVARKLRLRSTVGAPIPVDGKLWGALVAATRSSEPLPEDAEARIAAFTELVATAIANADAHAALTASRARVIAAADEAMRRIERDLHDGAQQRLASVVLKLQTTRDAVPAELEELRTDLRDATNELVTAAEELRDYARGIHPVVLTSRGLGPALKALARRSVVPVELDVRVAAPLPAPTEAGAYYIVSEALTNAGKYARASRIAVQVATVDGVVRVTVRDDGIGGAEFGRGSGLIGLQDRVAALGGRISLVSPSGAGTTVEVELPLAAEALVPNDG